MEVFTYDQTKHGKIVKHMRKNKISCYSMYVNMGCVVSSSTLSKYLKQDKPILPRSKELIENWIVENL